jgi:LmbE family N-acetylglucosaminyl deacetylase
MIISIWAPHPDDEIIGCYSILNRKHHIDDLHVLYFTSILSDREDPGIARACATFGFRFQFAAYRNVDGAGPQDIVLAPDPESDFHPLHRLVGRVAQHLFREGKIKRLIHYTTTMLTPYVQEVPDPAGKRSALDYCYREKADLWTSDHRYFLFEGYYELRRLGEL